MNTDVATRPEDRLAHYFAVVGVEDELEPVGDDYVGDPLQTAAAHVAPHLTPLDLCYKGLIRDRFPMADFELPFPSNVSLFCFPSGLRLHRHPPLPFFFMFVGTGGDGKHIYGHVLTFFEQLKPTQVDSLRRLGCATKRRVGGARRPRFRDDPHGAEGSVRGIDTAGIVGGPGALPTVGEEDGSPSHAPSGAADADEDGDWETIEFEDLYAPACLVLVSQWAFSGFREFLTKLYNLSLSPQPVPVERIICNFMQEVVLPPAGQVCIEYTIADTTITFQRPPVNDRISPQDIPFKQVFECLSIDNILKLMVCVLTERQILLHSSQLSLLSATATVLTAIIYPLQWVHVYIPVLPKALVQVLQAPMPFICGLPTEIFEATTVPEHVVQVDLANNVIKIPRDDPPPPIPPRQRRKLIDALKAAGNVFATRSPYWRDEVYPFYDLAFANAARPDEVDAGAESGSMVDWKAVRTAFFRFFVSLLLRYNEYVVKPKEDDTGHNTRFDGAKFAKKEHGKEGAPFVLALVDTQAFSQFVDERIEPDVSNVDVAFFDESIIKKRKRDRFNMEKRPTRFLDSHEWDVTKTLVALSPSTDGLEEGRMYVYDSFPDFQEELFCSARFVEPFVQEAPTVSSEGAGKKGKPGSSDPSGKATETVLAGVGANVYTTWFIVYTAAVGRHETSTAAPEPHVVAATAGGGFASPTWQSGGSRRLRRRDSLRDELSVAERGWGIGPGGVSAAMLEVAAATAPLMTPRRSPRPSTPTSEADGSPGVESADRPATAETNDGDPRHPAPLALHTVTPTPAADANVVSVTFGPGKLGLSLGETGIDEHPAVIDKIPTGQAAAAGVLELGDSVWRINGEVVVPNTFGGIIDALRAAERPMTVDFRKGEDTMGSPDGDDSSSVRLRSLGRHVSEIDMTGSGESGTRSEAGGELPVSPEPSELVRTRSASSARTPGVGAAEQRVRQRRGQQHYTEEMKQLEAEKELDVAFAVMRRMRDEDGINPHEMIFRNLLDACARTGHAQMAMRVLDDMSHAGIVADASIYNTLVRAFSMDTNATSTLPLGAIKWNVFKQRAADVVEAREGRLSKMKTLWRAGSDRTIASGGAGGASSGRKPSQLSGRRRPPRGTTTSPAMPPRPLSDSFQTPGTGRGADGGSIGAVDAGSVVSDDESTAAPPSEGGGSSSTAKKASSSWFFRMFTADDSEAAQPAPEADETAESLATMHNLSHREPGYGLVGFVFPDLVIDTERETCPECEKRLSTEDIQAGWLMDPNDYTTVCPFCVANAASDVAASTHKPAAYAERGWGAAPNQAHGKAAARQVERKPPRRFVARFSVQSSAPFWQGTTGVGTPLFCEYLPPWVLLKEVQTALRRDGMRVIATPAFRHTCPTIFWNLVLWFEAKLLPCDFLVPHEVFPRWGVGGVGGVVTPAPSRHSSTGRATPTISERAPPVSHDGAELREDNPAAARPEAESGPGEETPSESTSALMADGSETRPEETSTSSHSGSDDGSNDGSDGTSTDGSVGGAATSEVSAGDAGESGGGSVVDDAAAAPEDVHADVDADVDGGASVEPTSGDVDHDGGDGGGDGDEVSDDDDDDDDDDTGEFHTPRGHTPGAPPPETPVPDEVAADAAVPILSAPPPPRRESSGDE